MNSDPEQAAFFPPLASLLSGSSRLISSQTVHRAFALAPDFAADNEALEKFCYDPPAFSLLASCPDGSPKPSAQSKSDYEAQTAPIQVSGSQNGDYDLEQIKKDALELSAQLEIGEGIALRIVVLEWQSRAEEELLSGGNDASRATDLAASTLGKSLTGFSGSVNGMAKPKIDFADEKTRRRRQLNIFLKERSSRLRLGVDLLGYGATHEKQGDAQTWMDDLAAQLFRDRFNLHTDAPTVDQVFDKCMVALDEQIRILDDPATLPKIAKESEETMLMCAAATFNDLVTVLRLLLVVLHVRKGISTSSMVLSWFEKLESVNYFLTLSPSPAWPDTTELQCLVSLISFAIVSAPATVSQLQDLEAQSTGGISYPRLDTDKHYFEDEKCTTELNLILYRAALNGVSIMSPAIFAWAIVTAPIRDVARMHTEIRERALEDGSSDNETPDRRRSSRRDSRVEMSLFERIYASLQSIEMEPEVKDDPPAWFATYSTGSVFDVAAQLSMSVSSQYTSHFEASTQLIARIQLLYLLREGMSLTFYGGEVLEAVLAILTPHAMGNSPSPTLVDSRLCSIFLQDDILRREILDQALVRYPFELSPALRLLSSLASGRGVIHDVIQLLDRLRTITMMVPEHFNAYTLENEEENANEIRIDQDLHLFISRQALSWYGANSVSRRALTMGTGEDSDRGINVTSIPAGTVATVLKESRPMIFKLEHPHSGLEYLGLLLSTRLPNSEMCVAPGQPSLDLTAAADLVALVNALLSACLEGSRGEQESKFVLGRMSDALPDETDIINVVTELFEAELLTHLDQTAQDGSLELLIALAELFALLVKIEPGRLWTSLASGSLLGLNGGTNALAAVVGATETALGEFRFLSACATIFANLIDDAVSGLVKRIPPEKPVRRGRFDSPIDMSEYTPERTMQRVLSSFTSVMLEAWESLGEWRFSVASERSSIMARICDGFSVLLRSTYGLQNDSHVSASNGDRRTKDGRFTSVLFPAADAVLETFVPLSEKTTSMQSFSTAFARSAALLRTQLVTTDHRAEIGLAQCIAELSISLLRTTRTRGSTDEESRLIAVELLRVIPEMLAIFGSECSLRATVATLLTEMTMSLHSAGDQIDPPSLFGHLPTQSAKASLSIVSQLDRPLCNPATEREIWRFLTAVMKGRQQWLALYLLTGAVPKERLAESNGGITSINGKSLLTYALGQLSRIAELAPERSCGLLGFVSAAQGASIWASNEARRHSTFLTTIIDWVANLQDSGRLGNISEQILRASETRNASLICDILAQAVHASAEVGDSSVLKLLRGKLGYLGTRGHTVDAYNRSLHLNLTDNFRSRFAGVEVESFRRSAANPPEGYGKTWTYDLDLMDQALAHEKAWTTSMNHQGRSNGFRDEAARANVNFGLLSAQTSLLKAWSALATSIVDSIGSADDNTGLDLSNSLAKAVMNALEANSTANIDVPGTDKMLTMRAQMSFVVLSKLASRPPTDELRAILPAAYRALHASPADFDIATQEEDLHYYRLGLQVLFLAIQPHIRTAPKSMATSSAAAKKGDVKATDETPVSFLNPAVAGVLMDVVTKTVAPVWRSLAGNLHTNVACALPSDFAIAVALLQAVLAVPGIGTVHAQIAEVVASMQLVRSALSLYSWADRLAEAMDEDPVYGELAVQFIQVLSTVRPVAEHIALEGALSQLASANLSSYFRKPGGKGPFDEPRRMFTIWTEGMLPLCLNLLDAVGPPVAAEVSNFLNGFPPQLERAAIALENRDATKSQPHAGAVTLGLVQEAHSLCLISTILQTDTARAAAEGIDATSVGGLQGYDHEKVIEDGAGLARQKASLASRITAANAVEGAWAERMVDGLDSWLSARIFREVKGLAAMAAEGQEDGRGV